MHPLTLFEELGIRHFAGPFALNHILEEKVGILARSYYGHIENKAFLISGLVQTPSAKKIFETFSRLGVQKSCLYPWVSFSDGETFWMQLHKKKSMVMIFIMAIKMEWIRIFIIITEEENCILLFARSFFL